MAVDVNEEVKGYRLHSEEVRRAAGRGAEPLRNNTPSLQIRVECAMFHKINVIIDLWENKWQVGDQI